MFVFVGNGYYRVKTKTFARFEVRRKEFIVFGLLAPNLFAAFGIFVAYGFSHLLNLSFELGSYVLFAVLCGAASYIAVPAVQCLAIPEASPTLPLAASLGLTFSYNVTLAFTEGKQ